MSTPEIEVLHFVRRHRLYFFKREDIFRSGAKNVDPGVTNLARAGMGKFGHPNPTTDREHRSAQTTGILHLIFLQFKLTSHSKCVPQLEQHLKHIRHRKV